MSLESLLMGKAFVKQLTSNFTFMFLGVFLPGVLIFYSIVPQKFKRWVLLLSSYAFFWMISGNLIIYILMSTLVMHYLGIWIDDILVEKKAAVKAAADKEQKKILKLSYQKKQRSVIFLGVLINIGTLLLLKYSGFFTENINSIFKFFKLSVQLEIPKYIMPIGISFYTFQALSYILDVNRGAIKVERNLGKLALFLSFFPQIVEGPICRYSQTADQLWDCKPIDFDNFKLGMQRVLYGMIKKVVVADRLHAFVEEVFKNYNNYTGVIVAAGAVGYMVELYMDFSGAMDCVMGVGQIFGIEMPENFRQPFFSKNVSEFWTRWHISLGAWLRDYVFYPVTMSKPMKNLTTKARKKLGNHFGPLIAGSISLFCVWVVNGLWHGEQWHFLAFGMYHFIFILMGNFTMPLSTGIKSKLHISSDSKPFGIFQMIRTFVFVIFGEIFFKAPSVKDATNMIKRIFTNFKLPKFDTNILKGLHIDGHDFIIVIITLIIVTIVGALKERNVQIRDAIAQKNIVVRWLFWYGVLLFIVIFGAYGANYTPVDPMYANF